MEEKIAPQKKRATSASQIEKQLKEIYGEEDSNTISDPAKIESVKTRASWPWIIGIGILLLAVAGATWLGAQRFFGSAGGNGENVMISVDGPTAPRSGEAADWTVHYKNNEKQPLATADVSLRLPASLTVLSSDPALPDEKTLSWKIGTLNPGEEGKITFHARLLDALDAPIAVQAVLSYRPANFNSDFEKTAKWSSRIADSAVDVSISGPDESVPGDQENFSITVSRKNDLSADAQISGLKIRFDPEQALVIKTAVPAFSANDARSWTAPLPNKDPAVFTVTGSFSANAQGDTPVNVQVGTLDTNGAFIILAKTSDPVSVQPGDLALTLIKNGSSSDGVTDLGSTFHVSLDYENKSAKPLNDVQLSLNLLGNPTSAGQNSIDWSSLNDIRKGQKSGNTLTWSKQQIPELASIPPAGKGSIDIDFKTTATAFTTSDRNYSIDIAGSGLIGSIGDKKSGKLVSTPVLHTAISTDARVSAAAGLSGGVQPPKAGQQTTYRVVWALTNSLHEISGIKAVATLPENVSFAGNGSVNAGDIRFDDASRTVTWTLNRLPVSVKNASVDFSLNVTPTSGAIGKTMPILNETNFTALDTATNATVASLAPTLTTATENDPSGGVITQ